MTAGELDSLVDAIGSVMKEEFARRDAEIKSLSQIVLGLRDEIAELKARPELKFAGPYRNGESYSAGCCVQRKGLWLAERATSAVPGQPDSGWRLIVKEGYAS